MPLYWIMLICGFHALSISQMFWYFYSIFLTTIHRSSLNLVLFFFKVHVLWLCWFNPEEGVGASMPYGHSLPSFFNLRLNSKHIIQMYFLFIQRNKSVLSEKNFLFCQIFRMNWVIADLSNCIKNGLLKW